MKRLTERDEHRNANIIALSDMMPELYAGLSFTGTNALTSALNRLAAYEDTGLQPEEIISVKNAIMGQEVAKITEFDGIPIQRLQDLAQAEKDGRLVVLPCKAGDLLYEVDLPKYGVITCKVLHVGTYNGPAAYVEGNPMVSAVIVGVEVVEGHGQGSGYAFEAEDFGKTVFLTREEAEAALKGDMGVNE